MVVDAVSVGEIFYDRNVQAAGKVFNHLVDAAVVGTAYRAVFKMSENNATDFVETRLHADLLQHQVKFVGRFFFVFKEQDAFTQVRKIRRTAKVAEEAEAAADQSAAAQPEMTQSAAGGKGFFAFKDSFQALAGQGFPLPPCRKSIPKQIQL